MPTQTPQRERLPEGWGLPIGTGVGAGIGLVFGQMPGQLALGLVFGAAVGLVLGTVTTSGKALPADRRRTVLLSAIAILAAGVAATVVVLLA